MLNRQNIANICVICFAVSAALLQQVSFALYLYYKYIRGNTIPWLSTIQFYPSIATEIVELAAAIMLGLALYRIR